jgi:hypothetical protein
MEWVGVLVTVLLGVPAIWYAALAWKEAKRATSQALEGNERAGRQEVAAQRAARIAFAEKARATGEFTDSLGRAPSEQQHFEVDRRQRVLRNDALLLREPGAEALAWYVSLVFWKPSATQQWSPRDNPEPGGAWKSLETLLRDWVEDPAATEEWIRRQGLALVGYSDVPANIRQWHSRD